MGPALPACRAAAPAQEREKLQHLVGLALYVLLDTYTLLPSVLAVVAQYVREAAKAGPYQEEDAEP